MSEVKPRDILPQTKNIVITCMDRRFHRAIRLLLQSEHDIDIDECAQLKDAAPSRILASGGLLSSIEKSRKLHGIENVYIFDHIDCGGFGGLAAYENNEAKEAEAHFESLGQAEKAIHEILPEIVVVSYVVGLDGQPVTAS